MTKGILQDIKEVQTKAGEVYAIAYLLTKVASWGQIEPSVIRVKMPLQMLAQYKDKIGKEVSLPIVLPKVDSFYIVEP